MASKACRRFWVALLSFSSANTRKADRRKKIVSVQHRLVICSGTVSEKVFVLCGERDVCSKNSLQLEIGRTAALRLMTVSWIDIDVVYVF